MNLVHTLRRCVVGKWPHEVVYELFGHTGGKDGINSKLESKAHKNSKHVGVSDANSITAKKREPN